jgi:hypothetical protein
MRANRLFGPALALAACLLFLPTARAQVGDCPYSTCVESQTSLVYNPQTNMMDAFTTAKTDYSTASWYDLCVNLAVMRVNTPLVVNWDILWPSTTPSSCVSGAVQLELPGSVAATPGRQYFAEGLAELHVYRTYSDEVPDCGAYCDGYWYDAYGYSLLSTSQPSNANWPSIIYTYPYLNEPVPVYTEEISMIGSGATAWAPPVINSVSPNQWPAGETTTFTIDGAGFGYSPILTITGNGITGYTNPCASSPSSSCDTQIVATVTIDANTPGGSAETITVTANGPNPSGFLPVPTGQSGQATAQASTLPWVTPPPRIMWGPDTDGSICLTGSLAANTIPVVVGQRIAFSGCLPQFGAQAASESWTPNIPDLTKAVKG